MADEAKKDEKINVSKEIDLSKNIHDLTLEELKAEHVLLKESFEAKKSSGKASDILEAKKIKVQADAIALLVSELQTIDDAVADLVEAPVAEETTEEVVAPAEETDAPVAEVETVELPEPDLVTASAEMPSEFSDSEIKIASQVYTASAASEGQHRIGEEIGFGEIGNLLKSAFDSGVEQRVRIANLEYKHVPQISFSGDAQDNLRKVLAARVPGKSGSDVARMLGFDDSEQARTAAWGCDPADVDRTVISCVVRGRPVAESLPTIVADRLNLKFPGKATFNIGGTATSGTGLISTRTSGQTAIVYDTRSTWKTILDLTCGSEVSVDLTEYIGALRFTEQQWFSSPETVNEAIQRVEAQLDINMERGLITLLDAALSSANNSNAAQHTFTGALGSASIARAIAQEKYQIIQNGAYTEQYVEENYKVYIDAGLMDLMIADQGGRANAPDQLKAFTSELVNAFDMDVVVIRGGTDPSITVSAQSNGAIPALPTAWPIRILNPDNFRLVHGPDSQLSLGPIAPDIESVLTNSRAAFMRTYEGLIDLGKCVGGRVIVTVPLDSASRIAAATTI